MCTSCLFTTIGLICFGLPQTYETASYDGCLSSETGSREQHNGSSSEPGPSVIKRISCCFLLRGPYKFAMVMPNSPQFLNLMAGIDALSFPFFSKRCML
jgi:hypothetical protein